MPEPLRQRQPAIKDPAYMGWIARLPCVACQAEQGIARLGVHVAHLAVASDDYGKRETGKSEKASDRPWTLPLCPRHHMDGRNSQHSVGEPAFWTKLRVNPFALCLALSAVYGTPNHETQGAAIIGAYAGPRRLEWREGLFPLWESKRRGHADL